MNYYYLLVMTIFHMYTMLCPSGYRPMYYTTEGYYCYSDITHHNLEPQCYL